MSNSSEKALTSGSKSSVPIVIVASSIGNSFACAFAHYMKRHSEIQIVHYFAFNAFNPLYLFSEKGFELIGLPKGSSPTVPDFFKYWLKADGAGFFFSRALLFAISMVSARLMEEGKSSLK